MSVKGSLASTLALVGLAAASLLASGCGHTGALREEASIDFNCPESRIHIHGGGRTKDVEGCGQRGVYRWTGRNWVREDRGQQQPVTNAGPQPVRTGPPPVTPAQPAQPGQPSGPQPIRTQPPAAQPPASPTGGPQAPLPPSQPPPGGQSL